MCENADIFTSRDDFKLLGESQQVNSNFSPGRRLSSDLTFPVCLLGVTLDVNKDRTKKRNNLTNAR